MPTNPPIVDNEIPSAAKWNTLVGRYDVNTTLVDVVSSAALTTIYQPSIGAGHMSTDRLIRGLILGDYLNNSGAARTLALQIYWSGLFIYQGTTATIAASANRRSFALEFWIANLGSASSQKFHARLDLSGANLPTTGLGRLDAAAFTTNLDVNVSLSVPFGATTAKDTSVAQTLWVDVQHSVSDASLSLRKQYAQLELG